MRWGVGMADVTPLRTADGLVPHIGVGYGSEEQNSDAGEDDTTERLAESRVGIEALVTVEQEDERVSEPIVSLVVKFADWLLKIS